MGGGGSKESKKKGVIEEKKFNKEPEKDNVDIEVNI